jgi:hypothetical protein
MKSTHPLEAQAHTRAFASYGRGLYKPAPSNPSRQFILQINHHHSPTQSFETTLAHQNNDRGKSKGQGVGHLLSAKNLVNESQRVLRKTILCQFNLNFPNAVRSFASKGRSAPLARLLLSSPSLTAAPLRACAWHDGMKYSVARPRGRKSTPGREIYPHKGESVVTLRFPRPFSQMTGKTQRGYKRGGAICHKGMGLPSGTRQTFALTAPGHSDRDSQETMRFDGNLTACCCANSVWRRMEKHDAGTAE